MAWPGTLPPLNHTSNYTESRGDASIRTPTDTGAGKTRPRPDAPNVANSFSQIYTSAQVDTLETYYLTTLAKGSLTFDETNPRTGASETYRFVGAPAYTHLSGPVYRAEFVLEVMP